MPDYDIAVIGGGLTGCASAYYLARSGARVVVLERGQLNQGASGQNAGSLHFQLEYRLIRDIERRVRELEHYLGLARNAVEQWRGINEELGSDIGLSMEGGLMVAETPDEIRLLEHKLALEEREGLSVDLLDGDAARELAPYLSEQIRAALFCADEGHCNPRLLTPAYARRASESGARFELQAEVCAVRRARGRWQIGFRKARRPEEKQQIVCEAVLNAAGAWAVEVAAMANLHLPLFRVALTVNATERTGPRIPHLVQRAGQKLSLKQTEGGNVLIGGGWQARLRQRGGKWASTESPALRFDSVVQNLRAAADVVPVIRSLRLLRTWTGTTVITSDDLPILGEIRQAPGFFVAVGGAGFTFGPTYARLISELILTGASSCSLEPFSPSRFGGINAYMG